jgi:hypothetical protein
MDGDGMIAENVGWKGVGEVQNIDDWCFGDWCFIGYAFEKKRAQ